MSDRLALAHAIEDAGIPRAGAEGMATAIASFVIGSVATRADLQASETALRADIQALRRDTHDSEAGLRHDLQASEAKLTAQIAAVAANRVLVQHQLMIRLSGVLVVLLGLLFAALHAWPPH